MQRKLVMRSSVDVRSSAGSGDADAIAPNTAQFAVKQVVGSTKTITVADQLHLSRFAGDTGGHYYHHRRPQRAGDHYPGGNCPVLTSRTAVRQPILGTVGVSRHAKPVKHPSSTWSLCATLPDRSTSKRRCVPAID